jgi:hypothetical protein
MLTAPSTVYPCFPAEACPAAETGNTSCYAGYEGVRCQKCLSGYFRSSGKCVRCISVGVRWSVICLSGLFALVALAKFANSSTKVPGSLRVVLFWFQFLAVFPSLSSVWPPILLSVLNVTNLFSLDFGFLGLECDAKPNSYFLILVVNILFPLMFFGYLTFQNILLTLLKVIKKFSFMKAIAQVIFVTNFLSIQLITSMFQAFNCVSSGDGKYVIRSEPTVVCGSPDWKKFVIFNAFAMMLYVFITPGFVIYKFKKANQADEKDTLNILIHPMTQSYRPGAEYFELLRFIFRVVFVLLRDVLPLSSEAKIVFLILMLVLFIWIETTVRPYSDQAQQNLSIL